MKNKMKKMLLAGLAVAMLAVGAVGCGVQSVPSDAEAVTAVENATGNETGNETEAERPVIRVGSLKGPTSMGLMFLMEEDKNGSTMNDYEFQMATAADEILPLMIKGELDIALVPANVAGVLYNKTKGGVSVVDINTLGVLYMISGDASIKEISDLKGKTIYLTGKGTTPDYTLQYVLSMNGLSTEDCVLEYKSEATEVAALLAEQPDAVGLLPQPFVTVACTQNQELSIIFSMDDEWRKAQGDEGTGTVTGVTVVRKEFLETNEAAVKDFLLEHDGSATAINEEVAIGAGLVVEAGIIAKEPIAQKAIPYCGITCVTGEEMKKALSAYLEVLFDKSPESIGGALPGEDFYYVR